MFSQNREVYNNQTWIKVQCTHQTATSPGASMICLCRMVFTAAASEYADKQFSKNILAAMTVWSFIASIEQDLPGSSGILEFTYESRTIPIDPGWLGVVHGTPLFRRKSLLSSSERRVFNTSESSSRRFSFQVVLTIVYVASFFAIKYGSSCSEPIPSHIPLP